MLTDALAALDAVFDDIRYAQSLEFVDARFKGEWQRLSREASKIQQQIDEWVAASTRAEGVRAW